MVLHGDVHHGNVLNFGARGWLAIDPRGLVGERAFDHANLLCNPDVATAAASGSWLDRRRDADARLARSAVPSPAQAAAPLLRSGSRSRTRPSRRTTPPQARSASASGTAKGSPRRTWAAMAPPR